MPLSRALVLTLLLTGCGRLQDFTLGDGFTVQRSLVTRCRATGGDERVVAQIIGVGSALCWESIFEEGFRTGRTCGDFQARVAASDCTDAGLINTPNQVDLVFRVGAGQDIASADFLTGRWARCEDQDLSTTPIDGAVFFSPRDPPELVLGDRDIHGVLRPSYCGDTLGEPPMDTDVLDTGGRVDTGRPDTGRDTGFDTAG